MGGLLAALDQGRANVRDLDDPAALRGHADALLMVRHSRFSGFGFYAASPNAERLIGAAMMLDPTVCADGSGHTLIVGVNIASGTQIARAATRLRESGNEGVLVGVVLNALIEDWQREQASWTVPEVDVLLVLDGDERSVLGELAQRGECGVGLAFH